MLNSAIAARIARIASGARVRLRNDARTRFGCAAT
jgi:hypothetical protein